MPYDARVHLAFDTKSIDGSGSLETAKAICSNLQKMSEDLVRNRGRLLIIDNNCHGINQLFGNLTVVDDSGAQGLWTTELCSKYRSNSGRDQDGSPIPMNVPMPPYGIKFQVIRGAD